MIRLNVYLNERLISLTFYFNGLFVKTTWRKPRNRFASIGSSELLERIGSAKLSSVNMSFEM